LDLAYTSQYSSYGLDESQQRRLARLGDLILSAELNITAIREPGEIERQHFLDSLSLLRVPAVPAAAHIADIGSGGGLPALVLALVLPQSCVTAVESQRKKCLYIANVAAELALSNLSVVCCRAEDYGRSTGRDTQDVVVSRAVASLPVVAEYSIPLLRLGGRMVAMRGHVSDQERIQASKALGILGAGALDLVRLEPFEGASNRWVCVATKIQRTPDDYPRRSGLPAKRPLG
jgi:16S rRNA (guanine527-N7)-methyltransferase